MSKKWGGVQLELKWMEEEGIVVTRVRGKEDKRSVIIITIYATRNWEVVKKEI